MMIFKSDKQIKIKDLDLCYFMVKYSWPKYPVNDIIGTDIISRVYYFFVMPDNNDKVGSTEGFIIREVSRVDDMKIGDLDKLFIYEVLEEGEISNLEEEMELCVAIVHPLRLITNYSCIEDNMSIIALPKEDIEYLKI
jgi:hypothetical protein